VTFVIFDTLIVYIYIYIYIYMTNVLTLLLSTTVGVIIRRRFAVSKLCLCQYLYQFYSDMTGSQDGELDSLPSITITCFNRVKDYLMNNPPLIVHISEQCFLPVTTQLLEVVHRQLNSKWLTIN